MSDTLKQVKLDGKLVWKLKCPDCKIWGHIDDGQFHGRVSCLCNCGYHKTVDWSKMAKKEDEFKE